MPTDPRIIHLIKEAQKRMFRIALDPTRYGLTLKAISMDSAIGYDSLRDYAGGDTVMPLTALYRLCDALPAELLSLLLPEGLIIAANGEKIDHDDLAANALDYAMEHARARHPDSPAGVNIAACEDATLTAKAVKLKGVGS